jgi:pimeloyl-ACP methyl ester carboxylesterase
MGYVWNESLYGLSYDWRKSNNDSASWLRSALTTIRNSSAVPYATKTKADIIAHSMGGLVSRAYIQGGGYNNDVRKVVFVASPHKGFPITYRTWEGMTWSDYLYNAPGVAGGSAILPPLWIGLYGRSWSASGLLLRLRILLNA